MGKEKKPFSINLEKWLEENGGWGLDPPQEFIDNWTRIFENRIDDALKPVWRDLWFLHNWVKTRKPQTILEFGSGCSTAIMAHALWHNRKGWIDSVEDGLGWVKENEKIIQPYLSSIVNFYYCPILIEKYNGEVVFRYHGSFPAGPDFIYLDGPILYKECGITINPLELEFSFPKGFTMIIDGRGPTVEFYLRNFRRRYRWVRIKDTDIRFTIFELLE